MPTPSPSPITSSEAIDAVCTAHGLSIAEFHALRARATEAKTRAYCPYSNFRVGAALLARAGGGEGESGGRYVLGANVENASYPVTTCAERVALGTAVVEGLHSGNGGGFRAIAVSTDAEGPASPCGMCRQFIREFCELSMPILMFDKNDTFIVMTLGELLPLSFGPDNMGIKDPAKP